MGCDSAATASSGEQTIVENLKVFQPVHGPWFVVGFAGSFRMGQLLRYSFVPPPPPPHGEDIQGYIATDFVNAMRQCFEAGGFAAKSDTGREVGGYCLVGYQGRIFRIEDDFQAIADASSYSAMGSGELPALGALYATEGMPVAKRMELALGAAAKYSAWCRPPFHVVSMAYSNDNWEQVREALKPKRRRRSVSKKRKGSVR